MATSAPKRTLLGRMATYEKVIVLGGDVHYGTNIALDWWSFDRATGAPSPCLQLIRK